MNILVIEDEPLILKSLKKLLELRGATVETASLGRKAIKLIKTKKFDRIICDLMLQDITGFDIIEESKNTYSIDEIGKIFIIITAYSSEQVLEKASDYGCVVLSKPFSNMKQAIDLFINNGENFEDSQKR